MNTKKVIIRIVLILVFILIIGGIYYLVTTSKNQQGEQDFQTDQYFDLSIDDEIPNPMSIIPYTPTPLDVRSEMDIAKTLNKTFISTPLIRRLAENFQRNMAFSGLSLQEALFFLLAGSERETFNQLQKIYGNIPVPMLHQYFTNLNNSLMSEGNIKIANSIWVRNQYNAKPMYLSQIRGLAQIYRFDSNTQLTGELINKWVKTYTNNMIEQLNLFINDLTRLIIVNVIYFKGSWKNKFESHNTKPDDFYGSPTIRNKTMMMRQTNNFDYYEDIHMKLLKMDYEAKQDGVNEMYRNSNFCMVFILATTNTIILPPAEKIISYISRSQNVEVDVRIPKFEIESDIELMRPLKRFVPDIDKSHYRKMLDDEDVIPNQIIQKCKIRVDEEGTEASVATAIRMDNYGGSSQEKQHKTFYANRPFSWAILYLPTQQVIFQGDFKTPQPRSLSSTYNWFHGF